MRATKVAVTYRVESFAKALRDLSHTLDRIGIEWAVAGTVAGGLQSGR